MKYIFVTGGVVSSLGKGLTSAALGALLEQRGLRVRLQKFDPYLNVDPGTMSPFQHGEVYVLNDGAETDLDLGHYERFTSGELSRLNNLTSGKVYETVRQTRMSAWMPISRSFATDCWLGLVFSSPAAFKYGSSVQCRKRTSLRPTSSAN